MPKLVDQLKKFHWGYGLTNKSVANKTGKCQTAYVSVSKRTPMLFKMFYNSSYYASSKWKHYIIYYFLSKSVLWGVQHDSFTLTLQDSKINLCHQYRSMPGAYPCSLFKLYTVGWIISNSNLDIPKAANGQFQKYKMDMLV